VSDIQNEALKKISPGRYNIQRWRTEQEMHDHPYLSATGQFLPSLLLAKPGIPTATKAPTMAFGAGLQGGMNAWQQYVTTGTVDPSMVAYQAFLGGAGRRVVIRCSEKPSRVLARC